jgi:hypothetical protein
MSPVAEVRKADDALPGDTRHLAQDALDVVHRLQRLRQNDRVEHRVGEHPQAGVEVLLDHVDAVLHAFGDVVVADLDPVAAAGLRVAQMCEQRAVAAAEVEHATAGPYPVGDLLQVGAQRAHCCAGIRRHAPTSRAMSSK